MKKIYFSFLIAIITGGSAIAQDTINCSLNFDDTLKYVMSKTNYDYNNANSSLALIGIANNNDGGGQYGYTRYGQYYEAPSPVKVTGAKFYGIIYSGSADSIWVKLYNMNAGVPDTVIDSVYTPLNFQPGFTGTQFYYNIPNVAVFPNQPVVTSDYMIAVENRTSRDYYITRTTDGNGNAEALAYTYYEGISDPTYDGWYNVYSFGAGWDFDFVLEPVIEYSGILTSIVNSDTLCDGDTVIYNNSFAMNDTAIFNNKYYSAYSTTFIDSFDVVISPQFNGAQYTSLSDSSFVYSDSGMHQLSYIVDLGYPIWTTGTNNSSCSHVIYQYSSLNQVASTQTICLNQTLTLYPGVFNSYQWNTGQLTDSIQVGPFLQADSLYYSVMVSNGMCSGEYGYPVIIDNCVGIEENEITFDVYPNPTSNEFTINGNYVTGSVIKLTNLLGEMVYSNTLYSNLQTIDVSGLPAGFYTLSLMTENRNITKKIQIVK